MHKQTPFSYVHLSQPLRVLLLAGIILSALTAVVLLVRIVCAYGKRRDTPGANLSELLHDYDYITWYSDATGYDPSLSFAGQRYFGPYSLAVDGAQLYLGYGTARPAEQDGALLASYAVTTGLQAQAALNEQGFYNMTIHAGTVYVPGTDPCCGDLLSDEGKSGPYNDEWDWGNAYVFVAPGPITKHRNLTNTLHTWGLWFEAESETLFASASGHLGDSPEDKEASTFTGQVFSSYNAGDNWLLLADYDDGVGTYRTYDIIGFAGSLFVNWQDRQETGRSTCGLAVSNNDGQTWGRLPGHEANCARHLAIIRGRLASQQNERDGLVLLNAGGLTTTVNFPQFRAAPWAYSYLAEDSAGGVYVLTEDGRIMRATFNNLPEHWETLVSSDRGFISIAYWPEMDTIVVADRGENGRLWTLDPATAVPITIAAAPAVDIRRSGENVVLDMGARGNYRIYRSTLPYFLSDQYNRIASATAVATFTDNGIDDADVIGDVTQNYFYLVRTVNDEGLSPNSSHVGEFDFAIQPGD